MTTDSLSHITSDRGKRLVAIVRKWADIYQEICEQSQHRKITTEDFAPIVELLDPEKFTRIGIYKDAADWPLCLEKYLQFAGTSLWSGKLRFINTVGNFVYQELEETITRAQGANIINTMSVYEFDDNDKVIALRVYLQQAQDVANVLILGSGGK